MATFISLQTQTFFEETITCLLIVAKYPGEIFLNNGAVTVAGNMFADKKTKTVFCHNLVLIYSGMSNKTTEKFVELKRHIFRTLPRLTS